MWQKAKNLYHLTVAFLAHLWYGFPAHKLTVIGVTGTSGKTTTTHMIYEILKEADYKVSLLSSIKAEVGGQSYDTGFHVTTPDPHVLPRFLKMAVDKGDTHFVLEVSSHGLDQNRAAFVHFKVGVLTTLSHEHLDYHKTFENYARAKFKLLHQSDASVLPEEGISEEIKNEVGYDKLLRVVTFGLHAGDQTQDNWQLKLRMPGEYVVKNALAAASATVAIGVNRKIVKNALEKFSSLPGRYEEIPTGRKFRAIIDFAHKPDALEAVLKTARLEIGKKGRVIVVYGCASKRDLLKRPLMGEISGRLADVTVLTDEDPRFEYPMKIINEIANGCEKAGIKEMSVKAKDLREASGVFFKIPSRKEAIRFTLQDLAASNDLILFCGKGHEASMNYKGVEHPWSEHKAVREALK